MRPTEISCCDCTAARSVGPVGRLPIRCGSCTYVWNKAQNRQWRLDNPEAYAASQNKYLQSNWDEVLRRNRQRKRAKNPAVVGTCPICKDDNVKLVRDHDHECCPSLEGSCGECARERICGRCNTMLGQARDDVFTLLAAAEYLGRHRLLQENR